MLTRNYSRRTIDHASDPFRRCSQTTCVERTSQLCSNCAAIFDEELINQLDDRYPLNSRHNAQLYRLYSTLTISTTGLLSNDCHLCFLQGRRLRQVGALLDQCFWIRSKIESGDTATRPPRIRFSYSHVDGRTTVFDHKDDSFSQTFDLMLIDFGGRQHACRSKEHLPRDLSTRPSTSMIRSRIIGVRGLQGKLSGKLRMRDQCATGNFKDLGQCGPCVSTGSQTTFSRARRWIDDCLSKHQQCRPVTESLRKLPSRLIRLDRSSQLQARLVATVSLDTSTEYTTLSYCWV